jgi:hypothetical protein
LDIVVRRLDGSVCSTGADLAMASVEFLFPIRQITAVTGFAVRHDRARYCLGSRRRQSPPD